MKFIKECVGNELCLHQPNRIDCEYHGCTVFDCWCRYTPAALIKIPRYISY